MAWISTVVLTTFFGMALGMVWYHPNTVGGLWMRAHGHTEESIRKLNGNHAILAAVLSGFIQAYFAEHFIVRLASDSSISAQLTVVAQIWVGFIVTAMSTHLPFINKHWPTALIIDSSFHLVQLLAQVLIRNYYV